MKHHLIYVEFSNRFFTFPAGVYRRRFSIVAVLPKTQHLAHFFFFFSFFFFIHLSFLSLPLIFLLFLLFAFLLACFLVALERFVINKLDIATMVQSIPDHPSDNSALHRLYQERPISGERSPTTYFINSRVRPLQAPTSDNTPLNLASFEAPSTACFKQ